MNEGTMMSENMGLPTNTLGGTMSMDKLEANPHYLTEPSQTEKWEELNDEA